MSEVLSGTEETPAMEADDERSFDDFFRAVYPGLVGQAYLFTGDQAVAQDLAQEALARAWVRWGRVRTLDRPEAWVRRVLHNLAISEARWHRRRRRIALPESAQEGEPDLDMTNVAAAVAGLPPKRRRALVLHDVAGVPVEEIAEELGVPSGTVRSWLSRDRAALAARLAAEEKEAESNE